MRKPTVTLTIIIMLLCTLLPATSAKADTNPFTNSNYRYYVWDDLSGKADKTLTIPTSGSNADIYYYNGSGQTIYKYQSEKLRIAQANGWQMVMLTTGRQANSMVTRDTEGFGFYIKNQSGGTIIINPIIVGDDFYTMKTSSTAYLLNINGTSTTVTSLSSTGGVEIPNGFEGHIAVPYSNTVPNWGYTSGFTPGSSPINYFTVYVNATFSQGSNYIEIDNMFVYGVGATPYKEYLVKGGSSFVPLDPVVENPFADSNSKYFIWDNLNNMADMTIPLPPADGQQNAYVKTLFGAGTHQYKYVGGQLHVVGASGWKHIQLDTGNQATAAQTANAEGFGFYVKNQSGRSLVIMPYFRGNDAFFLKAYAKVLMVDMDGWSNEEAGSSWAGVITIPEGFEGYILTPVSSLEKASGGSFTPGTDSLYGFSINLYGEFSNDGNRYVAFDNMFIYGDNLNTTTANAVDILFPDAAPPQTNPNTQPVAAPIAGGYNGNDLVGVDQFGRTFGAITGTKSGKDVGMFFWLWNGQPSSSGIYDMTEFMKTPYGRAELFSTTSTVAPVNQPYFWGEPLFGYYNSTDEYVLRKQIEMLTLAGIDFLVFDTTNTLTYPNVYRKLFKLMDEYQSEGWDVPKIAFYTHSQSIATTKKLYYEVYKQNLYPNLWYYYKGKPMIIAYSDLTDDYKEALTRDDITYRTTELPTEIMNFFSFKYPQWPNEGVNHFDGVPYVEWEYPQPVHNDLINVSVASQHWACMSNAYTHPTTTLPWGRGFDFNTNTNISANSDKGTFFQAQWNEAFKQDPDIVFIDGWNEWIGYKIDYYGQIVFVDAFTKEFSRDIEPMKGGHEDAFYLQTIKNIRQYKGLVGKNYLDAGKTINISGSVSQWDSGVKVYRAFGETNYGRNAYDYAGINKYTQAAPRNNIQEIRVVNDNNYIYFYIMCEDNITAYDSSNNWMNIFIGTGAPALGGWNGYDFVVNRSVNMQTGKTDITALSSNFSGTKVGEGDIVVNGRIMTIRLSRATLGLSYGQAAGAEIYFKVADGVTNPQNIENYYISGKSIPMGRLSYSYAGVKPAASTVNPITDTSIGIKVYEDFSSRPNMELPITSQNSYFWYAPNASKYKMSFNKQRFLITKAPVNEMDYFMLYLSSSTASLDLSGLEGAGLYIKNNTGDRILVSPYYIGSDSFLIPKGSGAPAKLITLGGDMTLLYDTGEFTYHASYSIPAGFEGYITFQTNDFVCNWHSSGCSFTPGNFNVGYFSLVTNFKGGCNDKIGENVVFDNLFFFGTGMTPYKQNLIRP